MARNIWNHHQQHHHVHQDRASSASPRWDNGGAGEERCLGSIVAGDRCSSSSSIIGGTGGGAEGGRLTGHGGNDTGGSYSGNSSNSRRVGTRCRGDGSGAAADVGGDGLTPRPWELNASDSHGDPLWETRGRRGAGRRGAAGRGSLSERGRGRDEARVLDGVRVSAGRVSLSSPGTGMHGGGCGGSRKRCRGDIFEGVEEETGRCLGCGGAGGGGGDCESVGACVDRGRRAGGDELDRSNIKTSRGVGDGVRRGVQEEASQGFHDGIVASAAAAAASPWSSLRGGVELGLSLDGISNGPGLGGGSSDERSRRRSHARRRVDGNGGCTGIALGGGRREVEGTRGGKRAQE